MVGHKLGEFSPTRQFSWTYIQQIKKLLKKLQETGTTKTCTRKFLQAKPKEKSEMMQKNKNIVKAVNKNVRSSPRKINILLKNIRGKKADIAIRDLSFARQRIAF